MLNSCLFIPFGSTCHFIIMNPYLIHMVPGTSVVAHISQLHAAMRDHMQNPQSEFHDVLERTRRLLWSLPVVAPWSEFRQRYNDFMITGEPGIDEERFLVLGAWNVVTRALLIREELEQRAISYDTLPQIFPALEVPIVAPPPPPQGPPPRSPPPAHHVNGDPTMKIRELPMK